MHSSLLKSRGIVAIVAVAALLSFAGTRARAADPEVRDDGHFFGPAAVEQANGIIGQIKQKFGKDVNVVTFAQIPESMKPRFKAQEKEQFYENWLRQEARDSGTNGVFILAVKDPGRLQVGVGSETVRSKAFTPADRDALRDLMLARFREKQYDQGLLDGVNFIFQRMDENTHGGRRTVTPETKQTTRPATGPASAPATKSEQPAKTDGKDAGPSAAPEPPVKPDSGAKPDAGDKNK
ncbi:MAG: hypothetical protein JWN24_789 [Phycisphaerales bacterium]|jgi:uncharacterized membrane protein YgcG|nr:hypothetical protein [Phycisphaerales bacterium]